MPNPNHDSLGRFAHGSGKSLGSVVSGGGVSISHSGGGGSMGFHAPGKSGKQLVLERHLMLGGKGKVTFDAKTGQVSINGKKKNLFVKGEQVLDKTGKKAMGW